MFKPQNLSADILIRKGKNVLKIGTSESVDALRIVSHSHDVAKNTAKRLDQLRLRSIRVLKFIHEDMLVLRGDFAKNTWLLRKEFQGVE